VVGAVAVFAVITASHQLSPFLIITPILLLTVFGAIRPRWLIIPLGLILAGYVLPRLGPLGEQYRLFDGFNPFKNGGGNAQSWGSAGQRFSALVVRVLSIVVWSVALFAIWRNRRRLGLVMVSVIIGFAPFVALAVASYGGEAIYRIFAFSLPWSALLIAGLWAGRRRTTLFGGVVTGVLLAAAALATVQGLHGQLVVDAVPASDVRAARYFYAHAPAGATLMLATDAFPTRLAANYGSYDVGHPANVALTNDPTLFEGRMFGPADLPSLQRHLRSVGGTASYLVISDPMIASSDYFGHYPTGSLPALDRALAASPSWKVFYADHGVRIYQLVSPAGP
jgi:hypothetical protein